MNIIIRKRVFENKDIRLFVKALLEQHLILLKIKSRMDWVNEVKYRYICKVNSKTNFEF